MFNTDDESRLTHAWDCIIDEFFDLCIKHSNNSKNGISVFKMLSKIEKQRHDDKNMNCAFQYITSDSIYWNTTLGPYKEDILKEFDPDKHLLISIHIPATAGQDETIGNIKIFDKSDKTNEIFLNLKQK